MAERVGISDVARAAGVSVTTVSHALSGRGKVSAVTRGRVEKLADEMGYAPNRIASALRRQRSGIIGLVSDEVATTPFAGQLLLGAQDAAAARGFLLMVLSSNRDPLVERDQIDALIAQQVDAIVYATMSHQHVRVPAALAHRRAVLVDAWDPDADLPGVIPDEREIGETATDLLITQGHRRIAHLTVAENTPAKLGRLEGYRIALERAGLDYDEELVITTPVERGSAATGLARVALGSFLRTAAEGRPTAVFCFNDQFAMGAYQAAALFGLRIPVDLSVVGVDNLELIAANLTPGLTTIALPHYEMGRWAVERAIELVDGAAVPPVSVRMPARLIDRESVSVPARRTRVHPRV